MTSRRFLQSRQTRRDSQFWEERREYTGEVCNDYNFVKKYPNYKSSYGENCLMIAINNMNIDLIKELIKRKRGINNSNIDGTTPLIHFIKWNYGITRKEILDIIKLFIEAGANVNAKGNYGDTALLRSYDDLSIIKLLVEAGADVNVTEKDGTTLLMRAAKYGKTGLVKFLVESGADIEAMNKKRQTALHLARTKEIKKILGYDPVKSIRRIVHPSKFYKWQDICASLGDARLSELKELAQYQKINVAGKNKRQICAELAMKLEKKLNKPLTCQNDTTILGDEINDIPRPLIYKVKEGNMVYCFNIIELVQQIVQGYTKNPYTNVLLPVNDIQRKFSKLQQIVSPNHLGVANVMETIKNSRIMNAQEILNMKITNLVSLLKYVSTQMISGLTELQIITITRWMSENPLFTVTGNTKSLSNFVDLVLRNLGIEDEYLGIRKAALETYITDVTSRNSRTSSRSNSRSSSASRSRSG